MTDSFTREYGFKHLTAENWLAADPVWQVFATPSNPENPPGAWVDEVLAIKLDPAVPIAVRRLFEIARGALVYSWMYYPLLTLGSEQLMRVHEAAVSAKCKLAGAPEAETESFDRQIKWLAKGNYISAADQRRWDAIRHLRNHASHPKDQSIFDPNMALNMLEGTVEMINPLFG